MFSLVVLATVFTAANAMVCMPNICDTIKQEPLNCTGSVIKRGGYCGCTDVCAKVQGEACQAKVMFGSPSNLAPCDTGLKCQAGRSDGNLGLFGLLGSGTCIKPTKTERSPTKCEETRQSDMITMVVYPGKWTARCDAGGNFLPMQCDISGHCFCVDAQGVIQGARTRGKVDCPTTH